MLHRLFLPVLFAVLYLTQPSFGQETSCNIILKNGNTIKANSYRMEGGRIYLKYPVGEASFELSKVKSVTGSDGNTEFFQDKGHAQPLRPGSSGPSGSTSRAERNRPIPPPFSQATPALTMQHLGDDTAAQEDPKPAQEREQKFNDFFDKYWQADEKTQEEMSKQMDKVFSDYLNPQ